MTPTERQMELADRFMGKSPEEMMDDPVFMELTPEDLMALAEIMGERGAGAGASAEEFRTD